MFEAFMGMRKEIADLKKNNTLWKNKAEDYEGKFKVAEMLRHYDLRDNKLNIEEAKNELRKEMQRDLVLADVSLAEARGKLVAYDKLMIDRQEFMTLIKEVLMALKDRPDIKVLKAE